MKLKHFLAILFAAFVFNGATCGGGGGDSPIDKLLPLLLLSSSRVTDNTIYGTQVPDFSSTSNNCSCGAKTPESGSTMSIKQDLSAKVSQHSNKFSSEYMPGEIIVKFKEGTAQNRNNQIIYAHGASTVKTLLSPKIGAPSQIRQIRISHEKSIEQAVTEFSADPDVEYAHPNYIYKASALPNDPNFSSLWGLQNTGQSVNGVAGTSGKDINARDAWEKMTDCSNVIVAVVDTGVNYDHRDLSSNMWDGGIDHPKHGDDFIDNDNDPIDMNGHGTHCAGTIGAYGNDGVGVCGVCWKVKIMAVRVLNTIGSGTSASIANGINFAISHGAHVINLSLGGPGDATMLGAMKAAKAAGVIVAAASGNSNTSNYSSAYPAAYRLNACPGVDCCNNIITVGAVDQNGSKASFSNYSTSWVMIGAPGVNILSLWPGQSVASREDFNAWTKQTGWGVGLYPYSTGSGNVNIRMLTNPAASGSAAYSPNLNSAAYKNFDLNVYGPAAVTLSFLIDYDLESNFDYVYFTYRQLGEMPSTIDKWLTFTGTYLEVPEIDLTPYMNFDPSLGFIITSDSSVQLGGVRVGWFDITRLYRNNTACRYLAGTSMATPHVAGVAALCIARYNAMPLHTYDNSKYMDIINSILDGASSYSSLTSYFTSGRMLNANGALLQTESK